MTVPTVTHEQDIAALTDRAVHLKDGVNVDEKMSISA